MHENHMDFWILDRLLTKDEVKFMLSFKERRHGRDITWLALQNNMSVEEAQKIVNAACDKFTPDIDYKKIVLAYVSLV